MKRSKFRIFDVSGKHIATHVREDFADASGRADKRVWWERPGGGRGLDGLRLDELPLYGSEQLSDHEGEAVVVCEGEKDAAALIELGILAVGTVTGAGATPSASVLRWLVGHDVILWPDHDEAGRKHMERIARVLRSLGARPRQLDWPGARDPGDGAADFVLGGGSRDDALALIDAAMPWPTNETTNAATPWDKVLPASVMIEEVDADVDWLVERIAAPGSVTGIASPRGLGKSHVLHALAVAVATGGPFLSTHPRQGRTLLLDRDNSRREVRRRLRRWGQGTDLADLMVLTRDDCPALVDTATWEAFPFAAYDLVILDSLGAATEGIEDNRGGDSGRVLAPLLDLARRGPAVVVAMNVPKDGRNYRGSGVIADRVDILYEVRDATDFKPDAKSGDWWLPLSEGQGESGWAVRAGRRRKRESYRLAFVPTKFRIGEEPDPWCVEIDLADQDPWRVNEVTEELEAAHRASITEAERDRVAGYDVAVASLRVLVAERDAAGRPLTKGEAESHLRESGLTQRHARQTIENRAGHDWLVTRFDGRSKVLVACQARSTTGSPDWVSASPAGDSEVPDLVTTGNAGRRDPSAQTSLGYRGFREPRISSSFDEMHGAGDIEVIP